MTDGFSSSHALCERDAVWTVNELGSPLHTDFREVVFVDALARDNNGGNYHASCARTASTNWTAHTRNRGLSHSNQDEMAKKFPR